MDRKTWSIDSHERAVENFYSAGAEDYGDFHGGYLHFGLWEDGIEDYLRASENLVLRIGTMLGDRQVQLVFRRRGARVSIWIDGVLFAEADIAAPAAPFAVGCVGGKARFTDIALRRL